MGGAKEKEDGFKYATSKDSMRDEVSSALPAIYSWKFLSQRQLDVAVLWESERFERTIFAFFAGARNDGWEEARVAIAGLSCKLCLWQSAIGKHGLQQSVAVGSGGLYIP